MNLSRTYSRLRDQAGLPKALVLYLARHECGTKICREKGIEYARRLLGHSNISTTQRYMHLDDQELADAQDLIDGWAGLGPIHYAREGLGSPSRLPPSMMRGMSVFASFGMPITEDLIFKTLAVVFGVAGFWLEINFISGMVHWIFRRDYPRSDIPTGGPSRSRRFGRWIRESFLNRRIED